MEAELGDYVDLISGFAFKSSGFTEADGDVRLVRGANVGQGELKWDQEKRWPLAEAGDHAKFALGAGDLVLAMDRPWIEAGLKWAKVSEADLPLLLVQRVARLRATGLMDQNFLRCLIGSPQFSAYIQAIVTGVNIPHISGAQIKSFKFRPPAIEVQRQIGRVARTFDDLIENNRRRIEILEEMARLLYREWFVHFRFPGHEDVEMVDSELGPIPEGWETRRLSELVTTQYGYTESSQTDPVGPRYLRGMDMNKTSYIDWSTVPFCPIEDDSLEKFRIVPGDVFVIRMADPGKVSICEQDVDAVFASYLVRIRPSTDELVPYYLYFTLSDDRYQGWVTGASTGSTRKSVSAKVMTEPPIVVPRRDYQDGFVGAVTPIRELLTNLLRQNSVLREARDLLLPRLVSGELDVSELDLDEVLA